MPIVLSLDNSSPVPVYKQLMDQIESGINGGAFHSGELLPSMNELSSLLDISKETVKKAYFHLRDKGVIYSTQGKKVTTSRIRPATGRCVCSSFSTSSAAPSRCFYNSFHDTIGGKADITIYLHNQQINLLEYYLDENLGKFDYYVITPHFPLDPETRKGVLKALRRIPNRKLIIMDNYLPELPGNYGAVYQDFENDAYYGLAMGVKKLKKVPKLNVVIELSSLYHTMISKAVSRFCEENEIPYEFYTQVTPQIVKP